MMKTLQRVAPLFALLAAAACSEGVTGPGEPTPPTSPEAPAEPSGEDTPDEPTAPVQSVSRVQIDAPSDTFTLSMLADTVPLTARAFAADGTELDLEGRTVAWTSETPETMKITADGGAWLWPDDEGDLWVEDLGGGRFRFIGERGEAPASPGPQDGKITLTVDGVSFSRDFVQTSPLALYDVNPDGFCWLAAGEYTGSHGQEFTSDGKTDVEVDTRDRWGRMELSSVPSWASTNDAIIHVESDPDDAFRGIITVLGDGHEQILMTIDDWTVPVVEAYGSTVLENGSVQCNVDG